MLEPQDATPRKKTKVVALLALLCLILIICVANAGYSPRIGRHLLHLPYGDKLGHFILYGLTSLLLACAFPRAYRLGRLQLPRVIVFFLLFTLAEEWSQSLFASRTADPLDALAGCVGIFLGTWVAARWARKKE
jgi:polysaccharide biosynthesis protein VpsQ